MVFPFHWHCRPALSEKDIELACAKFTEVKTEMRI